MSRVIVLFTAALHDQKIDDPGIPDARQYRRFSCGLRASPLMTGTERDAGVDERS